MKTNDFIQWIILIIGNFAFGYGALATLLSFATSISWYFSYGEEWEDPSLHWHVFPLFVGAIIITLSKIYEVLVDIKWAIKEK